MTSLKTRSRVVIALFGIAACLTIALRVTATNNKSTALLTDLPLIIGDFTGEELQVEESIKDILETPNVLMRNYASPDNVLINLSVVYYEQYRVYFHMPEGCMTGQGSVIVASERADMSALDGKNQPIIANKLVLKQVEGNEQVFYFFIAGDLITASYPRMRLHLMMEHVKRRPTGAALVRFSTRTNGVSDEDSLTRLKEFIGQITDILPDYLSSK